MDNKEFALGIIFIVGVFCFMAGSLWLGFASSATKETSVEGCWILSDAQLLSAPNDSIECPFSVGDRIELHSNSTFEDANGLSGMWCSNGKWLSLTYFDNGWTAEVMEILSLTNDRLRLRIGVGNDNVQFWLLTYSN